MRGSSVRFPVRVCCVTLYISLSTGFSAIMLFLAGYQGLVLWRAGAEVNRRRVLVIQDNSGCRGVEALWPAVSCDCISGESIRQDINLDIFGILLALRDQTIGWSGAHENQEGWRLFCVLSEGVKHFHCYMVVSVWKDIISQVSVLEDWKSGVAFAWVRERFDTTRPALRQTIYYNKRKYYCKVVNIGLYPSLLFNNSD